MLESKKAFGNNQGCTGPASEYPLLSANNVIDHTICRIVAFYQGRTAGSPDFLFDGFYDLP